MINGAADPMLLHSKPLIHSKFPYLHHLSVMSMQNDQTQSTFSKPARRRRSRGTGQRTRTGCFTCKARRVKCDETKPACRRCTDFGRVCEGYPDPSTLPLPPDLSRSNSTQGSSRRQPPPSGSTAGSRRSSLSSNDSINEFQQYTMPNMPGYFAPGFWSQIVERVANIEPAVQCALNALGAAHSAAVEKQGTGPSTVSTAPTTSGDDSSQQVALQQYNAAINQLKNIMATRGTRGTETILVSCFLFVCIESLFGNLESATSHAEAGLKVYRDWLGSPSSGHIQEPNVPSSSNSRYCIWRLASELEVMLEDLTSRPSETAGLFPANNNDPWMYSTAVQEFTSSEHVASALIFLRGRLRSLQRSSEMFHIHGQAFIPDFILQQQQELDSLYAALEDPYHGFMSTVPPEGVDRGILVLQLQYLLQSTMHARLLGRTPDSTLARRYQDLLDTAEMIMKEVPLLESLHGSKTPSNYIDQSRSTMAGPSTFSDNIQLQRPTSDIRFSGPVRRIPSYTLSSEIVPCLFYTAKTAPGTHLRQRAISLLHASNAVEGIWNSHSAARLAEEVLNADLQGTPFLTSISMNFPIVSSI